MEAIYDGSENIIALDFIKHPTNYQPNSFTESKQEFTELEMKIVALIINQIGHMALKGEVKEGHNIKFRIPFTELTKQRYDQVTAAADSLQLKRIMYRNDKKQEFHFIVPFPSVRSTSVDGRKVIELTMFSDVVPHFAELGKRYTKYDIDVMLSLGSTYAKRFYAIISMFYHRGQKQFTYVVDELRDMLNYPEHQAYNDFKKNVLFVAQRELADKAGIVLDWEPFKKEGKRITELLFTIKNDRQLAAEGVEQDRKIINQMPIHEAVQTAWRLMSEYKLQSWQKEMIASNHNLLEIFYRVHVELTNGFRPDVKNRTAYLVKSLGIDKLKESKPAKSLPKAPEILPLSAPVPSVATERTASTQSLASLLGGIVNLDK